MPDYNNRIANWRYCNGLAIADQATDQSKYTIILYYYSMFQLMGGMFTFQNKYSAAKIGTSVPSIHRLKNSKSLKNH